MQTYLVPRKCTVFYQKVKGLHEYGIVFYFPSLKNEMLFYMFLYISVSWSLYEFNLNSYPMNKSIFQHIVLWWLLDLESEHYTLNKSHFLKNSKHPLNEGN